MGDGVAVPALGQHPDAHDAAHVPARRMEGAFELLRERLEALQVDGPPLRVPWPVGLPDRIQREAHPPVCVGLRSPVVGLAHGLGVHTDGADVSVRVVQSIEAGRRNAHRHLVLGEPPVDDLGECGVVAHDDEHGRAGLIFALAPCPAEHLPQPAEHRDRHVRILEHRFRLHAARLPPRSAGVSLGRIQRQILK